MTRAERDDLIAIARIALKAAEILCVTEYKARLELDNEYRRVHYYQEHDGGYVAQICACPRQKKRGRGFVSLGRVWFLERGDTQAAAVDALILVLAQVRASDE